MKRNATIRFIAGTMLSLTIALPSLLVLGRQDSECRTFRETGKTVCSAFLQYWQRNGGLQIFGYPISNPFQERSPLDQKLYTVQYFERSIFELHPENQPPYDVLLSQLGTYRFTSQYKAKDPSEPYSENLPRYPNAQNLKTIYSQGSNEPDIKMTYLVVARTSDILDFYEEVLGKDGWVVTQQYRNPDGLQFGRGYVGTDQGVPNLDVFVKPLNSSQIEVDLYFTKGG